MKKEEKKLLIAWAFSLLLMITGIVLMVRETSFVMFLGVYLMFWSHNLSTRVTNELERREKE